MEAVPGRTLAFEGEGLRALGASTLAGGIAGVLVGGLAGRIAMRVSGAMTDPSLQGTRTENGNVVGLVTIDGTISLVIFGGILTGVFGGVLFAALRPWLTPVGRWDGVALGLVVLAAIGGSTVIQPDNFDFRRFGMPLLNVLMFAGLFPLFGLALGVASRVIERSMARGDDVTIFLGWLSLIPAALLLLFLAAATVNAIARRLAGIIETDFLLVLALYWLLAAALARWAVSRRHPFTRAAELSRGEAAVTYAVLAVPVVVGLPILVRSAADLIR